MSKEKEKWDPQASLPEVLIKILIRTTEIWEGLWDFDEFWEPVDVDSKSRAERLVLHSRM